MKEGKTTLAEIQTVYPSAFKNTALADIAEVNPIVIHWMLVGQPVARWQAVQVLKVLSMVTREDYTLDTVDVALYDETQKEEGVMEQYNIYPVKGKDAREYLLRNGCSVGTEIMSLPKHLRMVPAPSNEGIFDVMHDNEKVFAMQHYSVNRWRVLVPVQYQISFSELVRAYNTDDLLVAGVIGSYEIMLRLLNNIPVSCPVAVDALERWARYTEHPYDLENVRVALSDS